MLRLDSYHLGDGSAIPTPLRACSLRVGDNSIRLLLLPQPPSVYQPGEVLVVLCRTRDSTTVGAALLSRSQMVRHV